MKSLNEKVYQRFVIQAKEAKEIGLEKLAEAVLASMPAAATKEQEFSTYSSIDLKRDIYQKLWKIAMDIVSYHGMDRADIQKLDETLSFFVEPLLQNVEAALDVNDEIGKLEPKLPGQVK